MATQNVNVVVLTGNLTKDPELVTTSGGMSICRLRLAVNTRRKAADGNWEDKPNYFDVTAFGAQADNASRYLMKGRPVAVEGRLEWREWETPEGQKRSAVQIIAGQIQYLSAGEAAQSQAEPRGDVSIDDDFSSPAAASQPETDEIPF